jgi:SAM-dependent methyltransferase
MATGKTAQKSTTSRKSELSESTASSGKTQAAKKKAPVRVKAAAKVKAPVSSPSAFIPNSDLLELSQREHLWNLNSVTFTPVGLELSGWCLPMNGQLGDTELVVNGFAHAFLLLPPAAIYAELYPWHPNAVWSGFHLVIPHATQDLRNAQEISVMPRSRRTGRTSTYSLEVLVSDLQFEMPPADIAARIGATNQADYIIQGRSIYRALERALTANLKTSFADYRTILDWGCGSGRVARHVLAAAKGKQKVTGFDIDTFAVEWATARFGDHFKTCSTEPPLALKTASVDLAYAYSVFTHLAEADMRTWMAELARVIKPGGIALFSVLSDGAMAELYPSTDRALLTAWNKRGIHDSVANAQLDTIDVAKDYYRNVWLKRSYIKQELGSAFEMVDFVPGFHFYQDLVVARRK